MRIQHVITILFLATFLALPLSSKAQAPETDQETTSSAELRQAIRDRIDETLKEKKNTSSQFLGFIGTITQVGSATFSLTCPSGDEKTIQITDETNILDDGQPAEISDLVVGNGVTVMGNQLDELIIEGRRILMSDNDFTENRQVVLGNITSVERQSITIQPRGEQQEITWETNRQTAYEDMNGQKITAAQLEEDQSALVITDLDDDDRYIKRIRLLVPIVE